MSELDKEIEDMTQEGFPMRCHNIDGVIYLNSTSLYNLTIYWKRQARNVEQAYMALQNYLRDESLKSGGREDG